MCYLSRRNWLDDGRVMPPRTLSEQWAALRPRFHRFRSWLGTPERTHSLILLIWPIVALVIAVYDPIADFIERNSRFETVEC